MTEKEIVKSRLANQLLVGSKAKSPADVVEQLVGIHAQDYAGSELSIGVRLRGSNLIDIEEAIAEREIVRTWAMRGTLHFIAGRDMRWILKLLAPPMIIALARRYKELDLDAAIFRKAESLLSKTLSGTKQLARAELVSVLEKSGISCAGQRAVFILHRASLDRVICFGVNRDKQQTHVLFEEWVPESRQYGPEESLAQLAFRYFAGHGPATIQDFIWWSGLKSGDANTGLELARSSLEHVDNAGKRYWMPPHVSWPRVRSPVAHLLPGFDDFLLGYKDRGASLNPTHARHLQRGGMFAPFILIDGHVVGTWSKKVKRDEVIVSPQLFSPPDKATVKSITEAAQRYSKFIGLSPALVWKKSGSGFP
ncbi:MAG TPA: winged helix DNA-binding domain-containing protein [Candidatus Kryptonia bacterium]